MDELLCRDRGVGCRSCPWATATGCKIARDLDLALVGWTAPSLPVAQTRIALAIA